MRFAASLMTLMGGHSLDTGSSGEGIKTTGPAGINLALDSDKVIPTLLMGGLPYQKRMSKVDLNSPVEKEGSHWNSAFLKGLADWMQCSSPSVLHWSVNADYWVKTLEWDLDLMISDFKCYRLCFEVTWRFHHKTTWIQPARYYTARQRLPSL